MRGKAQAAGLDNAVVVNTCAVTAEAVRQARQTIRKLRRERPDARIVVTGCAAQTEPATFAAMPEVDRVVGNTEKFEVAAWRDARAAFERQNLPRDVFGIAAEEKIVVNDIMAARETALHLIDGIEGRARATVQIQNGCDHRCTFCIIPYGRGNSRSVGVGSVVQEARRLVEAGFKEIVTSGVDLTSYGADLPGTPSLGELVQRILKHVPELPRLRLSSIDSIEVDPTLRSLIAEEPRLMPHFHLSVQSGDDLILKRMKRRHSRAHTVEFCTSVRRLRPDAAFGADLIVGFPTETEGMFENTLSLVDDAGLSYLHVFPFSSRKGTPAARMPQLQRDIVKQRAARLRATGDQALAAHLDELIGSTQTILVETERVGRTPCFAPVAFEQPAEPGAIVRVRIAGRDHRTLRCDICLTQRVPAVA
jgi:threonylcarbamoyladenosine tRNA methylthiotransferase MtaB